jgi:hypothetical protein
MRTNFHIRSLIIVLILITFYTRVSAQHESDNWYFGARVSLNFSSGNPTVTNDNILFMRNGTSVSDSMGNLLFYGYGGTIIDSSQTMMQNGAGMNGSAFSMNNGITLKKPFSDSLYNIFSIHNSPQWYNPGLLYFSELDMSLNGWKGAVPPSEKNRLISMQPMARMLGSTRHYNNNDQWVVTHEFGTANFCSYKLSDTLYFNCPVIYSNTGISINGGTHADWGEGQIKFSPDGSKAAVAYKAYGVVQVFDFDNSTGKLSNPISLSNFIAILGVRGPRSVEFSSNGKVLYVAEDSQSIASNIYQFDLDAGSVAMINSSQTIIGSSAGAESCSIQRAIDDKIYKVGTSGFFNLLDVIEKPNNLGTSCNLLTDTILVIKNASFGLPHLNDFYPHFTHLNLCFGDTALFNYFHTSVDSIRWYFEDTLSGNNNTSTLFSPNHYFTSPGSYQITLLVYNGTNTDTLIDNINITDPSIFNTVALGNDTSFCEGEELALLTNSSMGSILWSDSTSLDSIIVNQTGLYWVVANNKCGLSIDSINVVVHPNPIVNIGSFNPDTTENCNSVSLPGGIPSGGIWSGSGIIGNNFDPILATNGFHELVYSYTDINGCTNKDTTNIFVNLPTIQNYGQSIYFCFGDSVVIGNNTYYSTSVHIDTLQNIYMCDSIIITSYISPISIDTSVQVFGNYFQSNEFFGTSYQWLYCSTMSPVSGAVSSYFYPSLNGDYALAITKNGCTDTTSCHTVFAVGVAEFTNDKSLKVFPNPTSESIGVYSSENIFTIEIYNALGGLVYRNKYSEKPISLKGVPPGIYLLKVDYGKYYEIFNIIKH